MTPDERTALEARIHHAIVHRLDSRLTARQIVDLIEQRDAERDEARGHTHCRYERDRSDSWSWVCVAAP